MSLSVPEVFAAYWARSNGDILTSMRAALEADAAEKRRAPAHVTSRDAGMVRARKVATAVAMAAGATLEDIKKLRASRAVCRLQQRAWWMIREFTDVSYPDVGAMFNRHHTTIVAGVLRAKELDLADPRIGDEVRACVRMALGEDAKAA